MQKRVMEVLLNKNKLINDQNNKQEIKSKWNERKIDDEIYEKETYTHRIQLPIKQLQSNY